MEVGFPPLLSPQGVIHGSAFGPAKADGGFAAIVVIHLMDQTPTQTGRLVRNTIEAEFLQLNGARSNCHCGRRQKAQNTDQREQQGRQASLQGMVHFLHKLIPFFESAHKKEPSAN